MSSSQSGAWLQPKIELPDTAADDVRIGHLLGSEKGGAQIVLLGFPSDEGVRRNGGRVGAAGGPDSIRSAFFAMTPPPTKGDSFCRLLKSTRDMGNLEVSGVLERDQQMLAAAVAEQLQEGRTPVLLGGGHETSYGHFLGYVLSARPVLILNWDAHADVRRPKEGLGHSGSPFRQALEHPSGLCEKYHVAGLLNHCNAARHLRYLTAKGANYTLLDELTEANLYSIYQVVQSEALVSFDLDAVDQSWAPGVSAPAVGGMSVSMWLAAAKQAGVNPSVRSIDIVELNPRYDRDNQTSRLAALTLWSFYAGLALRSTD